MFLLESGKRAHPIFPVSHRVVILGLMAVTLDCLSTHARAFFFREQSETSHSPNPLTNNLRHKEPVTLPPREKCFEAAAERRTSSLQPVQRRLQERELHNTIKILEFSITEKATQAPDLEVSATDSYPRGKQRPLCCHQ